MKKKEDKAPFITQIKVLLDPNFPKTSEDYQKNVLDSLFLQFLEGCKLNDGTFELFCENNVLNYLETLLKIENYNLSMSILKFLSETLQNLKNPIQILYYFLSHKSILNIISYNYNKFLKDEDFCSHYIGILYALSGKLERQNQDPSILSFYYNEKLFNFPLFFYTSNFYNHTHSIYCGRVREITLHIFNTKAAYLNSFYCSVTFVRFIVNSCCYLNDLWIKLNEKIQEPNEKNKQFISDLKNLSDTASNLLSYFNDIFGLDIENINRVLFNSLTSYCISPLLLGTLFYNKKQKISMYVAIFALRQILQNIDYYPIIFYILSSMMNSEIPSEFVKFVQLDPPKFYSYLFAPPSIKFKNHLAQYIYDEYNENYNSYLNPNSPFLESAQIYYQKLKQQNDPVLNESEVILKTKDYLLSQLNEEDRKIVIEDHNTLSFASGIVVGITEKAKIFSFYDCYSISKKEKNENEGEYLNNKNLQILIQYFNSKDELLTILFCKFFLTVLTQKSIPKDLLLNCKMLPKLHANNEGNELWLNEIIMENLFNKFSTDMIIDRFTLCSIIELLKFLSMDPKGQLKIEMKYKFLMVQNCIKHLENGIELISSSQNKFTHLSILIINIIDKIQTNFYNSNLDKLISSGEILLNEKAIHNFSNQTFENPLEQLNYSLFCSFLIIKVVLIDLEDILNSKPEPLKQLWKLNEICDANNFSGQNIFRFSEIINKKKFYKGLLLSDSDFNLYLLDFPNKKSVTFKISGIFPMQNLYSDLKNEEEKIIIIKEENKHREEILRPRIKDNGMRLSLWSLIHDQRRNAINLDNQIALSYLLFLRDKISLNT